MQQRLHPEHWYERYCVKVRSMPVTQKDAFEHPSQDDQADRVRAQSSQPIEKETQKSKMKTRTEIQPWNTCMALKLPAHCAVFNQVAIPANLTVRLMRIQHLGFVWPHCITVWADDKQKTRVQVPCR